MKKITIGIAAIISLFSTISFAATTVTSKNDTSIPCYNGGFSFGLAGYQTPSQATSSPTSSPVGNSASSENREAQKYAKPDYK